MLPSEGIEKLEVYFWSVECSITVVNFVLPSEFIKGTFELRFSQIPILDPAQVLLRPGGKFNLVLEPEYGIDIVNEVKNPNDLILNLIRHAEDMRIILLEPPNPRQSSQSTFEFIPMQDTEVGHSNW